MIRVPCSEDKSVDFSTVTAFSDCCCSADLLSPFFSADESVEGSAAVATGSSFVFSTAGAAGFGEV